MKYVVPVESARAALSTRIGQIARSEREARKRFAARIEAGMSPADSRSVFEGEVDMLPNWRILKGILHRLNNPHAVDMRVASASQLYAMGVVSADHALEVANGESSSGGGFFIDAIGCLTK